METRSAWWQRILASVWLSFCFVFVYNGCNYISSLRNDVGTCAFSWEQTFFPFVPIFIIPYWSIDLFFVIAPLFLSKKRQLLQHLRRISFGIFVAGCFFLMFPLELAFARPEVHGWLAPFFGSLENFNNFYNCAPSLHIVLLTNLWPVYWRLCRSRTWLKVGLLFWFGAIELSTLVCFQHHIMDIFTGQLLGVFCLWLFPDELSASPGTDFRLGQNARPKLAIVYLAGAVVMTALAYLSWPHGMVFLWPACSFGILSLAYLGLGPAVFRKNRDGRHDWAAGWILWPYTLLAKLSAAYFNSGLPPWVEIRPGLRLGRRLSDREAREFGRTSVLDLTSEYEECEVFRQQDYLNVPVLDLTLPNSQQVREAVSFMSGRDQVYVHCSLGRGRSALIAAAFLVHQGASVKEALAQVEKNRPQVHLAGGAEELLESHASSLDTLQIKA